MTKTLDTRHAGTDDARRVLAAWANLPSFDRATVLLLCEAAGRIRAGGESLPPLLSDRVPELRESLSSGLDLAACRDSAHELVALVDAGEGLEPTADDEAAVRRVLEQRDRTEFRIRGAEALLGAPAPLDEDDLVALEVFDDLVRPLLGRLTRWNYVRGEAAPRIAAPARGGFWWRFEGIEVPPSAWDALPAVASLVARFPEAASLLSSLVTVEMHVLHRGRRRAEGQVISLRTWLAHRRTPGADTGKLVAAAAEAHQEVLVHHDGIVEIAWKMPNELVLYVLDEASLDHPPTVSRPNGSSITIPRTPKSIGRFSVVLDAETLDAPEIVVRLPLRRGLHEVRLPPAEDQ